MKLFQTAKKDIVFLLLLVAITVGFFYQLFFLGKFPYPGDLLVSTYEPYKSYTHLGFVPGSVPNKAQGPDVIKQLIPWKVFSIETMKSGQIPLWNPYNFSGNPHMANYQSGVFYPLNVIFFVLDFLNAWSIYIFITPLLSGVFMYLFLTRLQISRPGALLGAVGFSFSSYMAVWLQYGNIGHTFVWLPLMLYFADKLLYKYSAVSYLGFVLAGVFSFLAGYIQGTFYIYLVIVLYVIFKGFHEKKLNKKNLIIFSSALIFPITLVLYQLLPTLQLFTESTRGEYNLHQISRNLTPFFYPITAFAPDFFGNPAARNYWIDGTYIERVSYFGLIPLSLAIISLVFLLKKAEVKIFGAIFIFSIFISTDLFITRFFYLIPIPVISTTVASRILSIFVFAGAVLSAYGFDYLFSKLSKRKSLYVPLFILIGLVGIFISIFIIPSLLDNPDLASKLNVSKRNLVLPITTLGIFTFLMLFRNKLSGIVKILVLLIVILDLFYYFQKITPFSPKEFLYPSTPVTSFIHDNAGITRVWGYGAAYIESNYQTYEKNYSTEGNDPLHLKNYTELVASSGNGSVPRVLPRPDANIAPGFGKEDMSENFYRQKVLNVTGVKYVLNIDHSINGSFNPDYTTFPEDNYKLVWQEGSWQAYENLKVTPRVFMTNKYRVVEKNRTLETLYTKDFDERSEIVLSQDPKIIKSQDFSYKNRVVEYSPNKITIQTESNAEGLLYLSDNYSNDWVAYVNDKKTKIYLANHAFRAVVVPAGENKIIFKYESKAFNTGVGVSAASFIALLGMTFVLSKKNEK